MIALHFSLAASCTRHCVGRIRSNTGFHHALIAWRYFTIKTAPKTATNRYNFRYSVFK